MGCGPTSGQKRQLFRRASAQLLIYGSTMARPDPALPLRVPTADRKQPPREADGPRLRLVVSKGRLGVELQQPAALGALRVDGMALAYRDVRFPVDLSRGTVAFRNRRGQLEQLRIGLDTAQLQARLSQRCVDLLAPGRPTQVVVAPVSDGWTVGIGAAGCALCFDVLVAPLDEDVRLLVCNARTLGVQAVARSLALRALLRVCKPWATAVGGVVIVERAASRVVQQLLPLAGMRAPSVAGWRWHALDLAVNVAQLSGGTDGVPAPLSERVVQALELAEMCVEADTALLAGDVPRARAGYLAQLSRAPRHPALARRLADLDRAAGQRAEAALVTLAEIMAPMDAGVLGASLLAAIGDREGACHGWRRAAETEDFGWMAALCWLQLAWLSEAQADEAIDEALARAPAMAQARWLRFERQLRAGRLAAARAEAQHLEAAASGYERFEVLRRAGEHFFAARALPDAATCYERALRYQPASALAVAGLASALQAAGQGRRALDLFARAVRLGEREGRQNHRLVLLLARALVDVADDRPAAIARLASIPALVFDTFEARLLEARWRADLGDLAGARIALAGLGSSVEMAIGVLLDEHAQHGPYAHVWPGANPAGEDRTQARARIGRMLLEGARLYELDCGDIPSARNLLRLGLRVWPQSQAVRRAFRRLAKEDAAPPPPPESDALDDEAGRSMFDVEQAPTTMAEPWSGGGEEAAATALQAAVPLAAPWAAGDDSGASVASEETERLADQLSVKLQADPSNVPLAEQLMGLLEQLGRDHELLALLAGRIEDAAASQRPALEAHRRAVVERMLRAAEAAQRSEEAALYRQLLSSLDESAS